MLADMNTAGRLFFQQQASFESQYFRKHLSSETSWYNEAMEHRKSIVKIAKEKNLSVAECYKSEPFRSSLAKMKERLGNCERSLHRFLERQKAVFADFRLCSKHEIIMMLAKKTD